jgi:hypothetical protein
MPHLPWFVELDDGIFGGPTTTRTARRTLPTGAISASAAYVWMALAQGGALIPGMIAPQALLGISFAMRVAGRRRSVSVGRGHHACGVARLRKLRPRSMSASGRTGRKGIESDFRFWPMAEATAALLHGYSPVIYS